MKLDLAAISTTLDQMRVRMGAELVALRPLVIELDPIATALSDLGIEVGLGEINLHDDGTLIYQGYRVLVYIRDPSIGVGRSFEPRFHVAGCKVLERMRSAGRWKRYVVANRDDGYFIVTSEAGSPELVKLLVCQSCLDQLGWQGFAFSLPGTERARRAKAFVLKEFFRTYPKSLHSVVPEQTADSSAINRYPQNWPEVSRRAREAAGFRCSDCQSHLPGKLSQFLDVHHRNGRKDDSSPQNLEVLCVDCHSDRPNHEHLKSSERHGQYLTRRPSLRV